MKNVLDVIVYSFFIVVIVGLVVLVIHSMRLAAREKEFVKQHADEWNERVKRMQAKGRWNDVE